METELFVVMPVYNEEETLTKVVEEWIPVFRSHTRAFQFCILNDGSKDSTLSILKQLAVTYPEIVVVDKPNSGHGQTCVTGYKLALKTAASWVFQIDSDGQCDPSFFGTFWEMRPNHAALYGYRKVRDDGYSRFLISRVVSLVTWIAAGRWVKDANVPYRLMRKDTLTGWINEIPSDFHLANVLVAALQDKKFRIKWLDIRFRERQGGRASVKAYSFVKQGWLLFKQLRKQSFRDFAIV
jgi:glycosyltransferase involved in cell wall biosynthesis